jgi:hypothetical protein
MAHVFVVYRITFIYHHSSNALSKNGIKNGIKSNPDNNPMGPNQTTNAYIVTVNKTNGKRYFTINLYASITLVQ